MGKKIIAPMCYKGSCDTELFNFWVEKFLVPKLSPGQIVVMDNASYHKSEKTKKLKEKAKCELLFLPPYSPQLNPIEIFWANFKRMLTKIIDNFEKLADAIDYLFLRQSQFI